MGKPSGRTVNRECQTGADYLELSGSMLRQARLLHYRVSMETLVLTTVMMLSGLLALGSTRAVLGVMLHAMTRDPGRR